MSLPEMKVIISGGGTGGHVFPAIAIADALKEMNPGIDILFIGAEGRMEMEKVPDAGYPIKGLWISGIHRRLTLKNLSFPFKLVHSTLTARKIIKEFKPNVVVGVGGYASGPALRAATAFNIPTVLQEQNSYPGITNRLLAKKANFICVAYPGMEAHFPKEKIVLTGNPVRKGIANDITSREGALRYFNLDPDKPVILSVGGSLGAQTLNKSIIAGINQFENKGIQVIWQTGKYFAETAERTLKDQDAKGMLAFKFIDRMDLAYSAADVVVSRAGALAISEICLRGKPCILVPSPNVAEDHQTRNAMSLVSREAALMVTDASAVDNLVATVIRLATDEALQKKLSDNIEKLAFPNAAIDIARIVTNCAKSSINTRL